MEERSDTPGTDQLPRLYAEEHQISAERRELHRLIDDLYLNAPLDDNDVARLDALEEQERRISERRCRMHNLIDQLRAEAGLPQWRRAELDNAA
jgi:hypothetical protein